jgi:hypothetical protein
VAGLWRSPSDYEAVAEDVASGDFTMRADSWASIAAKKFPKAWINSNNDGPFGLVLKCKQQRVILFPSRKEADEAWMFRAVGGCGLPCAPQWRHKNHFVVDLSEDAANN